MANQVVWVDIPVLNLDRAIQFYSAVLGAKVHKEEFGGTALGLLPHQSEEVGGCLYANPEIKPTDQGVMIYLNAQGRLDEAIAAVAPNGGKVLQARHQIGPHGFRAVVLDSEGNRVALHTR
jgi:predicted enzyme related to lactoylglutathione lyase